MKSINLTNYNYQLGQSTPINCVSAVLEAILRNKNPSYSMNQNDIYNVFKQHDVSPSFPNAKKLNNKSTTMCIVHSTLQNATTPYTNR